MSLRCLRYVITPYELDIAACLWYNPSELEIACLQYHITPSELEIASLGIVSYNPL